MANEPLSLDDIERMWNEARERAERKMGMEHIDGVPWYDAPKPRRWHRCWVQTSAYVQFDRVERCACGAIRNPRFGSRWAERNSR